MNIRLPFGLIRPEERQRVAATLLEASPRLDLSGDFPCVHCGKLFRFELDPVGLAIDRLRASRTRLLQEVHTLAFYYHWSFPDILALPRTTRHEFLELIGDQLEGRQSWR